MVVNSININRTNNHILPKESLNRDGGQLIPPISTPSLFKLSLGEM
jgi:hypothetical protein